MASFVARTLRRAAVSRVAFSSLPRAVARLSVPCSTAAARPLRSFATASAGSVVQVSAGAVRERKTKRGEREGEGEGRGRGEGAAARAATSPMTRPHFAANAPFLAGSGRAAASTLRAGSPPATAALARRALQPARAPRALALAPLRAPPARNSRSPNPASRDPRPPTALRQTFLDRKEVTERVIQVLKNFEKVDPAKVTASAHFVNDLGLDSLDAVEVCMALEEEFVITIPDAEAEKILTAEDAIAFVSTHPNAK